MQSLDSRRPRWQPRCRRQAFRIVLALTGPIAPLKQAEAQYTLQGRQAVPAVLQGCWFAPLSGAVAEEGSHGVDSNSTPCLSGYTGTANHDDFEHKVKLQFSKIELTASSCFPEEAPTSWRVLQTTCYCPSGGGDCDTARLTLCARGEVRLQGTYGMESAYFSVSGRKLKWQQQRINTTSTDAEVFTGTRMECITEDAWDFPTFTGAIGTGLASIAVFLIVACSNQGCITFLLDGTSHTDSRTLNALGLPRADLEELGDEDDDSAEEEEEEDDDQ